MKQVNTRYYSEQIAAKYPLLPAEQVQQVCLLFMRQLYTGVARHGFDIAIKCPERHLKTKVYKRQHNVAKANLIAKQKARRLRRFRKERAERVAMQKQLKN